MNEVVDTSKQFPASPGKLVWDLFVELRKEVLESQKIRAQVIGLKVAFVSTLVTALLANIGKVPPDVLVVPAVAAAFFDILIASYGVSIKRIGYYLRTHVEPSLATSLGWPKDAPLWEQFMDKQTTGSSLGIAASLGFTALVALLALAGLIVDSPGTLAVQPLAKAALAVCLVASLVIASLTYFKHRAFRGEA
jgi:hypothetical protein